MCEARSARQSAEASVHLSLQELEQRARAEWVVWRRWSWILCETHLTELSRVVVGVWWGCGGVWCGRVRGGVVWCGAVRWGTVEQVGWSRWGGMRHTNLYLISVPLQELEQLVAVSAQNDAAHQFLARAREDCVMRIELLLEAVRAFTEPPGTDDTYLPRTKMLGDGCKGEWAAEVGGLGGVGGVGQVDSVGIDEGAFTSPGALRRRQQPPTHQGAGLYWAVLGCAGCCWAVLGGAGRAVLGGRCWAGGAGRCWAVLGGAGRCWAVLGCAGRCWVVWVMLGVAGWCWVLLGSAGWCG